MHPIDPTALIERPHRDAVAEFRARTARRADIVRGVQRARLQLALALMMVATSGAIVLVSFDGIRTAVGRGGPSAILGVLFLGAMIALGAVSALGFIRRGSGHWRRWTRFDAFAQANGLTFAVDGGTAPSTSPIADGTPTLLRDRFTSIAADHVVEYGNLWRRSGSGNLHRTRASGRLAIRFDGSTAPTITPELTAVLDDPAAPLTARVDGPWLVVTGSAPFDLTTPAIHQRVRRLVETANRTVA